MRQPRHARIAARTSLGEIARALLPHRGGSVARERPSLTDELFD